MNIAIELESQPTPTVSVIIPVYKAEAYLRACVDSVLDQSYTDFEVLLVDDGSPDHSGALCDEYAGKDARVRAIHKPNGGVSSARNAGLDAAEGAYIAFLDADDMLAPGFLERAVSAVRQGGYELYLEGFARMRRDGGEMYKSRIPELVYVENEKLGVEDFLLLLEKCYISSVWGSLFSRALIGELCFDTGLCFGEDLIFVWTVVQRARRIFASPEIGYFYIENPGSATAGAGLQKCRSMARCYRFIFGFDRQYWGREEAAYQRFCKRRWRTDYLETIRKLLHEKLPLCEKRAMFRLLYRDPVLRAALYAEETTLHYRYDPRYLLFKDTAKRVMKKSRRILSGPRRRIP